MIKRPMLRYHGGKFLLAPWIISHFPKHRVYTEVFGGAASCLLRKRRAYAEVYNDVWGVVVNVFRVVRDHPDELIRALELTPFAREEFDGCGDYELSLIDDPIERARRTIFRSFAGFGSAATNAKHATGFRAVSKKAGSTPAADWRNYPMHIPAFVDRLRGVIIENRPYDQVLHYHDSEETLHYVDPPYVHATRNMRRGNAAYAHEMTDDGHRELAKHLHDVSGMVVLSGYECELYEELYRGWHTFHKQTRADGASVRKETLWLNPAAFAATKRTVKTLF